MPKSTFIRGLSAFSAACALCLQVSACSSARQEPSASMEPSASAPELDAPDRTPPADGWRWESSVGLEVAVPASWSVNDTGCAQTDAPTVVRAQGFRTACLTPEPATKEIVEIFADSDLRTAPAISAHLETRDVVLDGEPAVRGEGMTNDGRFAGSVLVPSAKASVRVRVLDQDTLTRVLDSVRLVDVDHNGCPTARDDLRATPPTTRSLISSDTQAVSVCYYSAYFDVLQTSSLIEGDAASQLVTDLSEAQPGANPDQPDDVCLKTDIPPPDTILIAQGTPDRAVIEVSFSSCYHRGLRNGRDASRLTEDLVHEIMQSLDTGYGYSRL